MKEIQEILHNGTPKELLALFNFNVEEGNEIILLKFNVWSRYFFPNYFGSEDAPFHKDMNNDNLDIYRGTDINQLINIAFRGAGKDVKTQLFIAFVILNDTGHFRKYFEILSDDKTNSVQSVTDIYNMLVSPRIAELYPDTFRRSAFKREETKNAFTTSTGIKVIADTVGTGQRGAKQEEARPDFIWFNDFENRKTLRSAVITRAIWDNMEEARTGQEKGGGCLYTCNYISEVGNVHRLITEKQSPKKKVLIIPIREKGESTWGRYSLEDIKEMERTDDDFEGERMCKPNASKDIYFDRVMLEKMPVLEPLKDISGFKIYKKYNPAHRYAGGHDVAGGVQLDSSTSVFLDFDTVPCQVVAVYESNEILPEAFGDEIYSQGNRFGCCLLGVENNKFDQTILKAKILGAKLFMTPGKITKIGYAPPNTYGWNTNTLTKNQMLSSLRQAIEDGLIELNDINLIADVKGFTRNDSIDRDVDPRLTTRHHDYVMALAIAWQMKDHAKAVVKPVYIVEGEDESNPAI